MDVIDDKIKNWRKLIENDSSEYWIICVSDQYSEEVKSKFMEKGCTLADSYKLPGEQAFHFYENKEVLISLLRLQGIIDIYPDPPVQLI